jgi:hypothetical protein
MDKLWKQKTTIENERIKPEGDHNTKLHGRWKIANE